MPGRLDNENENRSHYGVLFPPPVVRSVLVGLVVAGLVAAGLLAAGCGRASTTGSDARVVKVVAAENFWGNIAGQIGGDRASVTSIISDPTADPHQYESDARNAASVADARIVIENGVGYDDFVAKLLSGTSNKHRVVLSAEQILGATAADANPHLWYDVPRVPEVASAIARALTSADPADAATFAANLKTFTDSLAPIEQLIARIRREYPHAAVGYTERVPGYLVAAAGLTVATPSGFAQAIEDGNEPSAGDTQSMNDLVTKHRIRALLYNAQATSVVTEHMQDLARRAGIPVVPVTETMPKNEPTYQAWQQHQLEALLTALGG